MLAKKSGRSSLTRRTITDRQKCKKIRKSQRRLTFEDFQSSKQNVQCLGNVTLASEIYNAAQKLEGHLSEFFYAHEKHYERLKLRIPKPLREIKHILQDEITQLQNQMKSQSGLSPAHRSKYKEEHSPFSPLSISDEEIFKYVDLPNKFD